MPSAKWHHVASQYNPADCASRGLNPAELRDHTLWWNGPVWLQSPSSDWPRTLLPEPRDQPPERRVHVTQTTHVDSSSSPLAALPDIVSSWSKLLRVTGIVLRFCDLLRQRDTTRNYFHSAKEFWAMYLQSAYYKAELRVLRSDEPIPRTSPLRRLNPRLDDRGIIRVGGRLRHALLSEVARHPIVLPQHRVSELLARHCHSRCLHGGTQLTLATLRHEFWVIAARKVVKTVIKQCVTCVRQRAAIPQQLMGDLPSVRVNPSRIFSNTGVDYAGPYLVRSTKGRGNKAHKAYIALFVCLSSRAIHLELVSNYSAPAFLAALKRFVSRRGLPVAMFSDNGTTFVGAAREISQVVRESMNSAEFREDTSIDYISWRFIPPGAPHFGGIWEAGVKSVKGHLKRVLGDHTLTFEEFSTLLCQVEACLNSRPIAPITDDPDDLDYLTPGHFLVGGPLLTIPERSVYDSSPNLLSRWVRVRNLLEHFWRRWRDEHLHHLQQRVKWDIKMPNLQNGSLVVLRQPNLPPTKWKLGRVIACHPGEDGLVRVVTLKTPSGILKRPIAQLVLQPVEATALDRP